MRKKGVNALELVFTLFILIIVVLVVINLFTKSMQKVGPTLETEQQAWLKLHGYTKARTVCNSLCDQYSTSYSLQDAVAFCRQVADIDLDGDLKITEGHGGVMPDGIPACEIHTYCFHIKKDCVVGITLSPEQCWRMMCEYYKDYYGISNSESQQLIQTFITPGTCRIKNAPLGKDQNWWYGLAKFNAVDCTGTGGGTTTTLGTTTTTLGTTTTTTGAATLSNCQLDKSTTPWRFTCNTNCISASAVAVSDTSSPKKGSSQLSPPISGGVLTAQPSIQNTLGPNDPKLKCPDTWTVFLLCDNPVGNPSSFLTCS